MKRIVKRLTGSLLACATVLSMSVVASAADSSLYSVRVVDNRVQFIQNGTVVGVYQAKSNDIALTTDSEDDFLICFFDRNNKYIGVTLDDQKSLDISGDINSLDIQSGLDDDISIHLLSSSDVETMTISSPNDVTISGSVGSLQVKTSAEVLLTSTANITETSINRNATVRKQQGAVVGKQTTTGSTTSSSSSSSSSSGDLRLRIQPINAEEGDTLGDLEWLLNENVEAYDRRTGDEVYGECRWDTSKNREISERGGTYAFTFYPDDRDYDEVSSRIRIYGDGISESITLRCTNDDGWYIYVDADEDDDVKLSSLKSELRDLVYAENDDGEEISGSVSWDRSGSTIVRDGRSYDFTFNPSSSRYENEEGSVTIIFE